MNSSIIVGGGITGLVAAYAGVCRGEQVTLVEPRALGGLITTRHCDGFTLECGPNVLVGKDDILHLIHRLGITDQIVYPQFQPFRQYVWYKGAPCEVPKSLIRFIRTPLISLGKKIMLLPNLIRSQKQALQADPSVAELFSPILGASGVTDLLDPALKGIYGGDVERLSAQSVFPELLAHLRSGKSLLQYASHRRRRSMFVLRGGMTSIVSALIGEIERLGAGRFNMLTDRVVHIAHNGSPRFQIALQSGSVLKTDRVVVTTAGRASSEMLSGIAPQVSRELSQLRFASLVVVHLSIKKCRLVADDAFGVLFRGQERSHLLGAMFNSVLFPHVAPHDRHLVTLCFGGRNSEAVCDWTDAQFEAHAKAELSRFAAVESAQLLGVTRWKAAIPQLEVGHQRIVSMMDQVEAEFPGLELRGVDRGGVGVADRVSAGGVGWYEESVLRLSANER